MAKKQAVLTDKVYRLKRRITPLSYMIQSKSTRKKPLLYFDGQTNRELRYARNQKTPFLEEQDGNAVLEPIIFESGLLFVPKSNPVLQEFLSYHPGNGGVFEVVDNEKDASIEVEDLDHQLEAQIQARELGLELSETLCRVLLGVNVGKMTSAEIKRDIRLFAKQNPIEFLDALNDPMLKIQDICYKLFDEGLVSLRNSNRDIYYNLKSNKKKIMTVPFGEDPAYILASYFQTDEGIEVMKILETKLEKLEN
ncbi:MAG: hypothetical protein CBB97_13550 [Candidatus Endolissoclinum sp. TMED37]|nr:MAG: hypothetical protein CBB97_13550 [Candidatus Endolissoclinum sp. TMED37]